MIESWGVLGCGCMLLLEDPDYDVRSSEFCPECQTWTGIQRVVGYEKRAWRAS